MKRARPTWFMILTVLVLLVVVTKWENATYNNLIISNLERQVLIEACNRGEEEAIETYRNLIINHQIVVSDGPVAQQLWAESMPNTPFPREIYQPFMERETPISMIILIVLGIMIMTKVSNIFRSWKKEVPAPQQTTVYCNYDRYRY